MPKTHASVETEIDFCRICNLDLSLHCLHGAVLAELKQIPLEIVDVQELPWF